ncbi:hypothetical protein D5086_000604 [Populus alba]|uniref:Uncharacterized protein n=1 Tax=Populus alba TaxID=43335 RepID=A0ACC4CWU2_POPAL
MKKTDHISKLQGPQVLQNDIDLLNPPAELEKRKHKLKRLVQSPNSFFMDVKCQGCFNITTVFSHSQTVVVCGNCQTVLCQPTGGRAKLTEGCSFRKKSESLHGTLGGNLGLEEFRHEHGLDVSRLGMASLSLGNEVQCLIVCEIWFHAPWRGLVADGISSFACVNVCSDFFYATGIVKLWLHPNPSHGDESTGVKEKETFDIVSDLNLRSILFFF